MKRLILVAFAFVAMATQVACTMGSPVQDDKEIKLQSPIEYVDKVRSDNPPDKVDCPTCDTTSQVVSVRASDASAKESGGNASFKVSRQGDTSLPLIVHFTMEGTAVAGIDYIKFPQRVLIPAGKRDVEVKVEPIDDLLYEGQETATLTLVPMSYMTGREVSASVTVSDNEPVPSCIALEATPGTLKSNVLRLLSTNPPKEEFLKEIMRMGASKEAAADILAALLAAKDQGAHLGQITFAVSTVRDENSVKEVVFVITNWRYCAETQG